MEKWISVKDKLPDKDKDGVYLVTRSYDVIYLIFFNEIGWYDIDDNGREYEITDVVAWMELPEPYKSNFNK